VFAGTKPPALFVSRDAGASWEELPAFRRMRQFWWFSPAEGYPFTPYVQALAMPAASRSVLLAGIELGAVLRSQDAGATWQGHRPGALRDCHSLAAHAADANWLYEGGGTGAGAAFSRDGGRTWQQPRSGLDRHYGWASAADPATPETWYVSLSPGPFKAHSGGNAQAYIYRAQPDGIWRKLGGGLPQPLDHMPYALLTDPAAPGHVFAGLSNGEVWRSTDRGDSWAALPLRFEGLRAAVLLHSAP
jgi:photosystem II stability/assembly factor-like uncharacterized protein